MATPLNEISNQFDEKALMARGKGKHTCPYDVNCDKGGVDDDGMLVVFTRNSAFR